MVSGEAPNDNLISCCLDSTGLEPAIRWYHANHYVTDVIREYSNFETEHSSAFHKVLMKYIEIVTNYIFDFNSINSVFNYAIYSMYFDRLLDNKGNNKITELRAILQRESQNS